MSAIRDLNKTIVEFVNAWSDVVELKLKEYAEVNPEKKNILMSDNKARVEKEPNSPFAYIYKWLDVTEDETGYGVIKPHKAKKRPNEDREPRKMRKNDYPIAADICDYFCDNPTGRFTDNSSIEHSVLRALPKLVEEKRIERYGDSYYPSTIEYRRKAMATELAALSPLKKDCFFSVSKNTYIVYFNIKRNDFKNEKKFFVEFFDKDLFEIISYENRIVILLRGKQEKCNALGLILRNTVRTAYNIQQEVSKDK